MKCEFKIGDKLTCKKSNGYKDLADGAWTPKCYLYKDKQYVISNIDDEDIEIKFSSGLTEYFGFEKRRVNYWNKWFYTKAELRQIKLKELGI